MGIDRIVDVEFRGIVRACDVLLPLELCLKRFGVLLSRYYEKNEMPSPPGEWKLSLYSKNTSLTDWNRTYHPKVSDLLAKLQEPNETNEWYASTHLHDSKHRYFALVGITGRTPDEVTGLRFDMRRESLLFGYRVGVPDGRYQTDREQYLKEWNEHEALMVEHERQEYHFMRTLFEMLPDAVQLDLFRNCEGIEDPDYCFTRKGARADAWCKERRWPELDQWCDEHEPEYWRQFAPKS